MAWQENYLATMGEGAEVIIWNTVNWQVHRIIDVNDSLIISISWKHNSTILAYGGYTYGKITLINSYRSECEPSVATPGELINAINTANVNPDADVIGLEAGTYTFTTAHIPLNALPAITSEITIIGNGATLTLPVGSALFGFFEVSAGAA
jgi:hypothetical protein